MVVVMLTWPVLNLHLQCKKSLGKDNNLNNLNNLNHHHHQNEKTIHRFDLYLQIKLRMTVGRGILSDCVHRLSLFTPLVFTLMTSLAYPEFQYALSTVL